MTMQGSLDLEIGIDFMKVIGCKENTFWKFTSFF